MPFDTEAKAPHIAFIIVNWKQKELTIKAIKSVFALMGIKAEVIVVDNNSEDGSVTEFRKSYPALHLIENSGNYGFAYANNQGIDLALSLGVEYLFFLNNDAYFFDQQIDSMVRLIRSDSKIAMVAPTIVFADEPDKIWYCGGSVSLWSGSFRHKLIRKPLTERPLQPFFTDYLTGCAILARTDLIRNYGGWDDSYLLYCEDVDLSLRYRQAGYRLMVDPVSTVAHKVSAASGGAISPLKVFHKARSTAKVLKRWAGWYHWLTIILVAPFLILSISLVLILQGKTDVVVALTKGLASGLLERQIPEQYRLNIKIPTGTKNA